MSAFIFHCAVVTSFTFGLSSMYVFQTTNLSVDLTDKNILFKTLQENTHIRLPKYFKLRRQSYLKNDMVSVLVSTPFVKVCPKPAPRNSRQEFFKLVLHSATTAGLSKAMLVKMKVVVQRKNLLPSLKGTVFYLQKTESPLYKLLMDVSSSQEPLKQNHLILTNRFNLHHFSSYLSIISKIQSFFSKIVEWSFPSKNVRSFTFNKSI